MYYTAFYTVEGDFVCFKCEKMEEVKGWDTAYSLEQIEEILTFNPSELRLSRHSNVNKLMMYTEEKPKFSKSWDDAILKLWKVMRQVGPTNRQLIKKVIENEFRNMSALAKVVVVSLSQ